MIPSHKAQCRPRTRTSQAQAFPFLAQLSRGCSFTTEVQLTAKIQKLSGVQRDTAQHTNTGAGKALQTPGRATPLGNSQKCFMTLTASLENFQKYKKYKNSQLQLGRRVTFFLGQPRKTGVCHGYYVEPSLVLLFSPHSNPGFPCTKGSQSTHTSFQGPHSEVGADKAPHMKGDIETQQEISLHLKDYWWPKGINRSLSACAAADEPRGKKTTHSFCQQGFGMI